MIGRPGCCGLAASGQDAAALVSIHFCQVVEGLAHRGMGRTERFFANRQRTFVECLSLAVLALGLIRIGEVIQALTYVSVVRTQRFFSDRQRTFKEPLRVRVLALCLNHDAQFVERNSIVGMVGSEACLCQPLKLLCIDLGGGVISARVMILKGLVDRDDVGRLGRCGREPSDRRQYEERDKSGLAARSRCNDFTPRHLSHGGGTIHGRKYGLKKPERRR
jgi:hypothetical protein